MQPKTDSSQSEAKPSNRVRFSRLSARHACPGSDLGPHANILRLLRHRSIAQSQGRFLAILTIVALGVGFFAGLKICANDMRGSLDDYLATQNYYDLRVSSVLGITEDGVKALSDLNGLESLEPIYTQDGFLELKGTSYTVRVQSLAPKAITANTDQTLDNAEAPAIALPELKEGRWPKAANEALLPVDMKERGLALNSDIAVEVPNSLTDNLKEKSFKVVGFVESPDYISEASRGVTPLGSGRLEAYMYAPYQSFASVSIASEVYLKAQLPQGSTIGSPEHKRIVSELKSSVNLLAPGLERGRYRELKNQISQELIDKRKDLKNSSELALAQFERANRTLEALKAKSSVPADLVNAQEEKIKLGLEKLRNSARISTQRASDAVTVVNADNSDFEARSQVNPRAAQRIFGLDKALTPTDLQGAYTELEKQGKQLEQSQMQLTQLAGQWETLNKQYTELRSKYESLPESDPQAKALVGQINAIVSQMDALNGQIKTLHQSVEEGRRALADQKTKLDTQAQALRSQQALFQAQNTSGNAGSVAGLTDWFSKVADKSYDYTQALDELVKLIDKASEDLIQANASIEQAQKRLDDLGDPKWFVLDPDSNPGIASYRSDAERMNSIALVFPAFFFLVALLVALTTMTRLIDDDRSLIGTLKALGATKRQIKSKYLMYAALASGLGSIFGLFVGMTGLPFLIQSAYASVYSVPINLAVIAAHVFNFKIWLVSLGLGLGCATIASLASLRASLAETPAALLLPRAPKPGKKILLERLFFWKHLSFSWKVSLRNTFRSKRRLFMTLAGVAGTSALLVVALGLYGSISDVLNKQYGSIQSFDAELTIYSFTNNAQEQELESILNDKGLVQSYLPASIAQYVVIESGKDDRAIKLVAPNNAADLTQFVTLKERLGQDLSFDDNSCFVPEKLARDFGLSVGSDLVLHEVDAIGKAASKSITVKVTGIYENYLGSNVYVGQSAYAEATKAPVVFNGDLIKRTSDAGIQRDLAHKLKEAQAVERFSSTDIEKAPYEQSLSSVTMVVIMLIVSAGALSAIVLYNLISINIQERTREIATLKVLGFRASEVRAYVFREILIQAFIGALLGLVFGTFLLDFVIQTAEVHYIMFTRGVAWYAYVIAVGLTMVFSALVCAAIAPSLRKINMPESLKAVD